MADHITQIANVTEWNTWCAALPSPVPAGEAYIAELAAGTWNVATLQAGINGKNVVGDLIVRPAAAARLNTITRALRGSADGVSIAVDNTSYTFSPAHLCFDGVQFVGGGGYAAKVLVRTYSGFKHCIFHDVQVSFDDEAGTYLLDSVLLRDTNDVCAWLPFSATRVEGCTFVHFSGATAVASGGAITAKNNIFASIGGATSFAGSMSGTSTNNAFNVGNTYGSNPLACAPANDFVAAANLAAADVRLKPASTLAAAGVAGAGTGTDIYGQARSVNSVGAFEQTGGGGGSALNAAAAGTDTASGTAAGTVSGGSAGTITIPPFIDFGTGQLKKGMAYQVDVRNISTGAHLLRKTGLTTHATTAGGSFSDPALAAGTTYEVVTRLADGSIGVWDYTAT
ncbi:MAG: hypothetical protein D3M94_07395 [Rhodocyclales bacterium GT-UBC]|nr:MAG: hypothetical protein D3M94_07395 [Rhodocyclales bacterium GT-UBC]